MGRKRKAYIACVFVALIVLYFVLPAFSFYGDRPCDNCITVAETACLCPTKLVNDQYDDRPCDRCAVIERICLCPAMPVNDQIAKAIDFYVGPFSFSPSLTDGLGFAAKERSLVKLKLRMNC